MEVLAVAVRLLADADAALAPEHSFHLGDHPQRLVEIFLLFERVVEGSEQDDAESVRPEIAKAVRPDALLAHPGELSKDSVNVLEPAHYLISPSGGSSSSAR